MYAGQMRTRLLIQRPFSGQDTSGEPIVGWTDIGPDWADFRVLSGLEAIKADALVSIVRASARIRWRTDLDASMRVLVGADVYTVKAVLPDEAGRTHVDLVLERVK